MDRQYGISVPFSSPLSTSLSNIVRQSLSRRESEDRNNCLRPQVEPDEVISAELRETLTNDIGFSPYIRQTVNRIQLLGLNTRPQVTRLDHNEEVGSIAAAAGGGATETLNTNNQVPDGSKVVEDLVEFIDIIRKNISELNKLEQSIKDEGEKLERILGPLSALKQGLGEDIENDEDMRQCLQGAVTAAQRKINGTKLIEHVEQYEELYAQVRILQKNQLEAVEIIKPSKPICNICLTREVNQVLIPCGHVLCSDCINASLMRSRDDRRKCYYCRTPVERMNKIHL